MTVAHYWDPDTSTWRRFATIQGPTGPKGDTGDTGPQGPIGPTPYVVQPGVPPGTNYLWVDTDEPDPDPLTAEATHLLGAAGEPAFPAGWSLYATGWSAPGYYKDNNNRVFIQGMLKKSTAVVAGETLFTLPVGYRPLATHLFVIISNSLIGRVDIAATGAVMIQTASNVWLSLAGINFRAEQ